MGDRPLRWAWAPVLLGLLVPPVFATTTPFYLRAERALDIAAPLTTAVRDDVGAFVGDGERVVLAEFLAPPSAYELTASHAIARLYLITGRLGMEACAIVTVELARRTPAAERIPTGSRALATSLGPRRGGIEPIVIDVPITGVVARPGERISLAIAIENACGAARNPKLLYDALGVESAIELVDLAPPLPPTTTTTSVTTLPAPITTTTTTSSTTLPWPAGCLAQPLRDWDAVRCRLDLVETVLAEEDPAALGGPFLTARLQRRLARARDQVALARSGVQPRRHLRRALEHLAVVGRLVRRSSRRGAFEADLGDELSGLLGGAMAEIGALARR